MNETRALLMPLDPHRDSVWWAAANRWASRHGSIRILAVESAGFWCDATGWVAPQFLSWAEAEAQR